MINNIQISIEAAPCQVIDWAIARLQGRVMQAPVTAQDQDVKNLAVPFTLYEVVVNSKKVGRPGSARVSSILVDRYSIDTLIGASRPSISFVDEDGRSSRGSVSDYYLTKEEAKNEADLLEFGSYEDYFPTSSWDAGGPLIEKNQIMFFKSGDGRINAYFAKKGTSGPLGSGETHLIAAMRCILVAHYGETMEVPASLLESKSSQLI